jgi:hypothetical protein
VSTHAAHEQLLAIQARAAALLEEHAYFAGLEVFTERIGDLDQKIRTKLAKLGLCVVVMTPSFSILQRQGARVKIRVRVIVEASETVLVNSGASGSQKPSLAVATAAAIALDGKPSESGPHYSGAGADPLNEYRLSDSEPVRLVPDPKLLVYHCELYVDTFLER